MDAAHKLTNKAGLFLVIALLFTAPGWAFQSPTFALSSNNVTLVPPTGQDVTVSSTSTPITFTVSAPNYSADSTTNGIWLGVSTPAGTTTGTSPAPFVSLRVANVAGLTPGPHSAVVTLTDVASVAPSVTITVNYNNSNGGGGGGTLTSSVNPINLSASTNGSASVTITISTTSLTAITISPTASTNSGGSWLTVSNQGSSSIFSGSPTNLLVVVSPGALGTGSYTGTVTVTPNNGSVLNIPVTMNVNGGGGSGSLTPSNSAISWSYTTNSGVYPGAFGISLSSSTGIVNYNATASSSNGWLLVNNATSTTGAVTSGLTISPSFQMNLLTTGVYTGYISLYDAASPSVLLATITVTLTVNGGSTAGLTISPNPLSFSAPVSGSLQAASVTITSSNGGTLQLNSSTNIGSWLSFGSFPGSLSAGVGVSGIVYANPTGLSAGTYSGTLNVTVGGTQSAAVSVTFVVGGSSGGNGTGAVAPTSLTFTWVAGSNLGDVSRQNLAITGPAGIWTSSVSTNAGGNWLSVSPSSGNLPDLSQTTAVISPSGLAAGTYTGTITISTPGGVASVSVNLNVISTGPLLIAQPGSLIFNYSTGQGPPSGQQVFPRNTDNSALVFTTAATDTWVTVAQPAGGTAFTVSVDPTGKGTGTYTSSVTITEATATNSPVSLPVVLVVNGGGTGTGNGGTLSFSPTSLSFSSSGGSVPASQILNVSAAVPTTFTVTPSQSWLLVNPTSGTTPSPNPTVTVSASPTNLSNGTYTATLNFNSNSNFQQVSVTFTVSSNTSGVSVTCTASCGTTQPALSFSGQSGSTSALTGTLSVSSQSGSSGVNFQATVTTGASWLSVSPTGTVATPTTLTATVSATNLGAGTYTGNIAVTPTGGGGTINVPVSLTVTAPPVVSASPTTLSFTYRAGDNPPASQAITVTGGTGLAFGVTVSSNGNWLSATPTSGNTPNTVNVSVSPSSLSPGTFSGTVTVSGTGTAQGTTTVSVTLTVTAPLPTIARLGNAGSYAGNTISPGEIISIFAPSDGKNPIGPATPVGLQLDSSGKVATTLGGVQVLVGGTLAPLTYVSASQVNAVVPYEVAPLVNTSVLVRYLGQGSNGFPVAVSTTAPGLFTLNSSGTGPGAILNQNLSTNSPGNPAARGETVVVYLTGEGATAPAGVTGKVTTVSSTPPLTPSPLLPIAVTIGGQPAGYTFAGEAPNFVSGVLQLNVQIPTTVAPGDQQIVVTIGSNSSQTGVTVSVK